ncbi:MAG: electron transport complex subunit RsxC [Pseudomonadota bacterium]
MRRVHDFHGGIHPPEHKEQSNTRPLRRAAIPAQLVLPLSQHIGPPARLEVAVGDRVLGGQRLSDLSSLPVHAPTSGIIAAIEDRPVPHASGLGGLCVVIDSDGEDEWTELSPINDFRTADAAQLIEHLQAAGIAGLGGAGFPTFRKLPRDGGAGISTLIINGTECEPYITADDVLMRERAAQIVEGVEILAHIATPEEILIGIEDNKPEAIAAMRAAIAGRELMEVVVFPTKYPSGGEKQLIEILTGKQVPSGGLPSDLGILCQNVGTAVAVADAVLRGRPLVSRVTTVTGHRATDAGNFEVLLGTPMRHLLDQAGCDVAQATPTQRLIMGGPMMGVTMPDPDAPIVKTTNCLLVPTEDELPTSGAAQACIRCGHCAEACPAQLLPQQLYWYARARDFEKLEEHHLADCIECGACSFVCPSSIPLVQYYRASKAAIREQRAEDAKAEQARLRFEARQERLARAAAEKEARRAKRKRTAMAKAADEAGADDPIQAAIARAKARRAAQDQAPTAADDKVAKIEARLEKARAKLAADDGSDAAVSAALQKAVAATEKKLADAQAEAAAQDSAPTEAQQREPEQA